MLIGDYSANATPGRGLRLLRRGGRLFGVALTRLCNGTPPPVLLNAMRRLRVAAPLTHGVFRRSANAKALRLLRDKVCILFQKIKFNIIIMILVVSLQ